MFCRNSEILTLAVWWSCLLDSKGSRMGNQSLPVWLPALPECSRLSSLQCSQTATGPELPEGQHRGNKCKRVISIWLSMYMLQNMQHIHTVSHYSTNQQWNNVAKTKYEHLKVLETCYLTTSVGLIILENESEMFDIVGLEEGVDLCLAEHRGVEENMRPTVLLTKSELQLSLKWKQQKPLKCAH